MGQYLTCTSYNPQSATREIDLRFVIPQSKPKPAAKSRPKLPKVKSDSSSEEDLDSSDDDEKSVSLSTLLKSLNSTKYSRVGSFTAIKSAYSNLYTFDIESRRFYYLRFLGETSKWIINDLSQAKLTNIPENSCVRKWITTTTEPPLLKFNYISISDSSILLVGGQPEGEESCSETIQYNFANNEFIGKTPLPRALRFPNLCIAEDNIYSCSGIEDAKLSTYFAAYNIAKDFWVEGPKLPLPHAFGNCIQYSGSTYSTMALNLSKITSNIAVIGGLSSVSPKIFNCSVSVYSCSEESWTTYQLEDFIRTVPRFIRPQLYIKSNNKIGVIGCKDWNGVYELDMELKSLTKKGELPYEQDLFLWGSSIEVAQLDRDPIFLSRNISASQEFSEFQRLTVLKYNHKNKEWQEV